MAFKPGTPKPPDSGRKPGVRNKVTTDVKQMVEEAFRRLGGAEWLMQAAESKPEAFMALIGRVIPKDVKVDMGAGQIQVIIRIPEKEKGKDVGGSTGGSTAPNR